MKRFLWVMLALALMIGVASLAWGSVIGTPHDLGGGEPCASCHTPHNGTGQYPLWNRIQTGGTVTNYTMYTSPTFDMAPTVTGSNMRYPSALCMVCHNGVASTLANYPGTCSVDQGAYDLTISSCDNLGKDMRDDHPVGFNYVQSKDVDNDGFPGTTTLGTGSSRSGIQGSPDIFPLYGDPVAGEWNHFECATCHSVHNTATPYTGMGDSQVYFLRATNAGSALCLQCHTLR